MKKYKNKIIAGIVIAAVLAFTFWWGGDSPELHGWNPKNDNNRNQTENIKEEPPVAAIPSATPAPEQAPLQNTDNTPIPAPETTTVSENSSDTQSNLKSDSKESENDFKTPQVYETAPEPIEPQDASISDKELNCTLSVRCDTILQNIGSLDKEKAELVPKDGIIFAEKTVTFYEGESVFNLLMREMKKNKIHLEFENTPVYNSAYIEGIGNLYEFDCGELSGWMYKVNDIFPNYGCSRYQLKSGDKVEWVYTCDLGKDVGGNYSARNGK